MIATVDDIRRDIMPRIVAWANALPNAGLWCGNGPATVDHYGIIIAWQPGPNEYGCGGGECMFVACGGGVERLRVIVDGWGCVPPHTVNVIDDDGDTYRVP